MLQIVDSVYSRLRCMREECLGALYGVAYSNTLVVTCLSVEPWGTSSADSASELQLHFPAGIDYCGAFRARLSATEPEDITDLIKEVQITDNPLFLERDSDGEISAHVLRDGRLSPTCLKIITDKEFLEAFVYLRLRGRISIDRSEVVRSSVEDCMFHFIGTDVYIYGDEQAADKQTLKQVFSKGPHSLDPRFKRGVLELQVLQPLTWTGEKRPSSLTLMSGSDGAKHRIQCSLDALCIADSSRSIEDLYGLLTDTIYRHLQLVDSTVALCNKTLDRLNDLQIYHFGLSPQFMSFVQGRDDEDAQFKGIRSDLHKRLSLPKDSPFFRRGNRLCLSPRPVMDGILFNVHEGLNPGVVGGTKALVHGIYSYHHYMQDGMNDDGWGCAYRSLQTLFSWFKYQGYTDAKIPSHKEIQSCLVQIGDKEKKFIGSREWIGSAEVGYCLNTWLGVTTYTLSYPSGTAMKQSGPDLVKHFQLQGTPIMIGGGQLAHTILGVDYNEETEEIKFLVLDPHYTGKEDLKMIQSKGWVGWKSVDFWKKNSFYNMCLPSRPRSL